MGLHWLGLVIEERAARGSTLAYSNSALTRLLKPALGGGNGDLMGGAHTVMLGCLSPFRLHAANTRNTLE